LVGRHPELEQCLFDWLTAGHMAGLVIALCTAHFKARQIAEKLRIVEEVQCMVCEVLTSLRYWGDYPVSRRG